MRFDWSVSLGPIRRLTMLVLIYTKDLGVPRIQPYELVPRGGLDNIYSGGSY